MTRPGIGHSLVDRRITESVSLLWEGPITSNDLAKIEVGIRALLVSNTLSVMRIDNPWFSGEATGKGWPINTDAPFGDHLLDYEFKDAYTVTPQEEITKIEGESLRKLVQNELERKALEAIPATLKKSGEVFAFLDAWYAGRGEEEALDRGRVMVDWEDEHKPWDGDIYRHAVANNGPKDDAEYLVKAFRAGLDIYSSMPIAKLAREHLFSVWPNKIFEALEHDHSSLARELRSPGCHMDLPPMTALVVSQASSREAIPEILRDMREKYSDDRMRLWGNLSDMWSAEKYSDQIEILRDLESAAGSIFVSAFPERFEALSVALDLARLSPAGISSAAKKLLDRDEPNARVQAVSFAHRLSSDFRKHLKNNASSLRKITTPSERQSLGI